MSVIVETGLIAAVGAAVGYTAFLVYVSVSNTPTRGEMVIPYPAVWSRDGLRYHAESAAHLTVSASVFVIGCALLAVKFAA